MTNDSPELKALIEEEAEKYKDILERFGRVARWRPWLGLIVERVLEDRDVYVAQPLDLGFRHPLGDQGLASDLADMLAKPQQMVAVLAERFLDPEQRCDGLIPRLRQCCESRLPGPFRPG